MSRKKKPETPQVVSAVDGGTHQSIARIELLLSALSEKPETGLKLGEVCAATGLGKATAHRLLSGLVTYRLADFDAESGRYMVGFKIFGWASGVGNRFGLAELARPSLRRLSEEFQDVVYLIVRNGDDAVCVERIVGSFPIKTLALKVGDRRPLGVGAGSAAILAMLPEDEQKAILARTAEARRQYPHAETEIPQVLREARRSGYTFVDGMIVPGICTVGAALCVDSGQPVAAISVSAISERMQPARRTEIAAAILREIAHISGSSRAFLRSSNREILLSAALR